VQPAGAHANLISGPIAAVGGPTQAQSRTCDTAPMRGPSALRVLAVASLGAIAAIAAHGGPALVADPRWLVPALAAAAACSWAAVATSSLACRGAAVRPWSPWATAGLLLAAQTAAHFALLGLGIMPAAGHTGSIALHVVLAVTAAAVLSIAERTLAGRAQQVLRRLLELLAAGTPGQPWPAPAPRPALAASPCHQRGPPAA
jgi:hypothetical protein